MPRRTPPAWFRVRMIVTALSAGWLCWLAWGPHVIADQRAADRGLHTISGVDWVLAASLIVGIASAAAVVYAPTGRRATQIMLGISLVWWTFISVLMFVAGFPVAGGLAAVGTIGGIVAVREA